MALTKPRLSQINTAADPVSVGDNLIRLNSTASGSNAKDVGIFIYRGTSGNLAIAWDESASQFALVGTSSSDTANTLTITDYKDIKVSSIELKDAIRIDSDSVSVGTTATVIDSFSAAAYRGAKYLITVSNSPNYSITECLVVHDGTTAYISVYGDTPTANSLGTFTTNINTGNVELLFQGVTLGNTVKVSPHYILV